MLKNAIIQATKNSSIILVAENKFKKLTVDSNKGTVDNMGTADGLRLAKKEALRSEEDYLLGAVLIKSGRVLGRGCNKLGKSNHLAQEFFDFPTIHAEVAALARLDPKEARGGILYVYRHKRTGCPGLAKPCERCAKILAKYGIKRVVYSTEAAPYYEEWRPTE